MGLPFQGAPRRPPIGTRPDGVPKPTSWGVPGRAIPRQVDRGVVIALMARPTAVAHPALRLEAEASRVPGSRAVGPVAALAGRAGGDLRGRDEEWGRHAGRSDPRHSTASESSPLASISGAPASSATDSATDPERTGEIAVEARLATTLESDGGKGGVLDEVAGRLTRGTDLLRVMLMGGPRLPARCPGRARTVHMKWRLSSTGVRMERIL